MSADDKADAAWDDYVSQQQEEKIEELERELNAANEKAQRYHEHILKHKAENEHLTKKIHQLYEGAEEQKQRINRLQETGDYLCAAAAFMGWHDKIEDWIKAKEAKP